MDIGHYTLKVINGDISSIYIFFFILLILIYVYEK